jgi:hypothetical protein
MGICAGKGGSKVDSDTNRDINRALMEDRKRLDNEVKLLLLGL